jgi:hypothetical protein
MSLFIRNGKIKSTLFLSAFLLSLVFAVVYVFAYILSAPLVAKFVPPETGTFWQTWLPPSLISIAASLPCVVPLFFMKDKRIVLAAFLLLVIYTALLGLMFSAQYSDGERKAMLTLLLLYLGLPGLWGSVLSFGAYFLFYGRDAHKRQGREGAGHETLSADRIP